MSNRSSVHPSEIAHIGDDPIADYFGAKQFGFQGFLLDRKGKLKEMKSKGEAGSINKPEIPDKLYSSFDDIISDLGLNTQSIK